MVVNFANLNCKESPTLVLRNLDGTPLQTLGYAFNVELDLAYNEVSTLTFSLPKYVDGEKTPHYDDVVGMRIVDLINCGQFILIDPQESDDGIRCVKECKAYSLEYEFAKKNIYLEAGTYNLFDGISTANPDTIIGRILERLPVLFHRVFPAPLFCLASQESGLSSLGALRRTTEGYKINNCFAALQINLNGRAGLSGASPTAHPCGFLPQEQVYITISPLVWQWLSYLEVPQFFLRWRGVAEACAFLNRF